MLVPAPFWLSSQRRPPCCSTIFCTRYSPLPGRSARPSGWTEQVTECSHTYGLRGIRDTDHTVIAFLASLYADRTTARALTRSMKEKVRQHALHSRRVGVDVPRFLIDVDNEALSPFSCGGIGCHGSRFHSIFQVYCVQR